jgi:hypothetical protein
MKKGIALVLGSPVPKLKRKTETKLGPDKIELQGKYWTPRETQEILILSKQPQSDPGNFCSSKTTPKTTNVTYTI